jgi:TonB family protein
MLHTCARERIAKKDKTHQMVNLYQLQLLILPKLSYISFIKIHEMPRKRKYISNVVKLRLLKEVAFKCPFCINDDIEHFQIHHINGNIEDNAFSNLLSVCPTCHSKITKGDIAQAHIILLKEQLARKKSFKKQFKKIEIEAEYPGGPIAFTKFLQENLRYPKDAIKQEIEGTVPVKFIVDEYGLVNTIEAVGGPLELQPEAIRVIKKSARWMPANQNGHHVKSYKTQPITFNLKKEFSLKNFFETILN